MFLEAIKIAKEILSKNNIEIAKIANNLGLSHIEIK